MIGLRFAAEYIFSCQYVVLVDFLRMTNNEDVLPYFGIETVIDKWLLPRITAQLGPEDVAVVTFWGDELQLLERDHPQVLYLMGLAGTGLDCCTLPPGRLEYLNIALPPIPLPRVASELQARLTAIGVEASLASDLLADRSILTCLYMTAGVPGYVALLWQVMLEFWQASESQTAR
ncbi:hypothetical protein WJX84_004768 [Apatococcus fuscideae]|uniref:Uncharacterized protein n=1 Tax=Apatococcus fuscideae TaxID=2026836 RepID=A0AAW1SUA1_9CHLO